MAALTNDMSPLSAPVPTAKVLEITIGHNFFSRVGTLSEFDYSNSSSFDFSKLIYTIIFSFFVEINNSRNNHHFFKKLIDKTD